MWNINYTSNNSTAPSTTPEEQVQPSENTVETVTPPVESTDKDNTGTNNGDIIDANLGLGNV